MSAIRFGPGEDASPAEWKSEPVQVSAAGSCVFESCRIGFAQDLRHTDSGPRMGIHKVDQGFQPSVGDPDIGIQQQKIIVRLSQLCECPVVSPGESPVPVEQDGFRLLRVMPQKPFGGSVGRTVVGYDDAGILPGVFSSRTGRYFRRKRIPFQLSMTMAVFPFVMVLFIPEQM